MIQIGHMNKVFHLKSGDVTALDNVTINICLLYTSRCV